MMRILPQRQPLASTGNGVAELTRTGAPGTPPGTR